jgi:serine/threonine protein kinase
LVERLGILHRDISETNIVLRVDDTEKPLGYLMDLDMATKKSVVTDQSTETSQTESSTAVGTSSCSHSRSEEDRHFHGPPKAARTGTPPYMATGVLRGHEHTVSHDLESFFYVLYLFLHTYDGPLPLTSAWPPPELFIGERTRRLPHVRHWPQNLQSWTSGNMDTIANDKTGRMSDEMFMWSSLRTELPKHWQQREDVRELIKAAYDVFWIYSGVDGSHTRVLRTDVRHAEFINALEGWLIRFPEATIGA